MSAQHRPLDLRRVRAVESGRGGGGGSGGGPSRECHQHLLGFLPNDVILGIFRYVGSLSLYTDAVAVSTFFRDHLTSPLAEELWKEFMEKDFRATSTSLGLQTQEVYLPGKFVPSSSTLSGIGALNVLLKPISLKTWRCLWARHQFRRRHLLGASIRTEATVYNADSQCLMMKYWSQMLRFVERHDCHGTIDTLQRGASAEDFERVKHFLGVPALHPDIVAFYSVCCGQAGALWSEDALFGGYRVYDRVENTRLAPLLFSAGYPLHSPTLPLDGLFSMMKRHQCIVLAFTAGFGHIVVVDAVTAKVTHLNPGSSSAFPLDPDDSAGNDSSGDTMPQPEKKEKRQSQLMRWIGKFAHGVDSGLYECDVLMNSKGASRFPVFGPGTTVAVTRGFRVHLSTIFECLSQNWVYRLRIRLLSPEEPGGYVRCENHIFSTHALLGQSCVQLNSTACTLRPCVRKYSLCQCVLQIL